MIKASNGILRIVNRLALPVLFVLLFSINKPTFGANRLFVPVVMCDTSINALEKIVAPTDTKDSAGCLSYGQQLMDRIRSQGYLEVSADTLRWMTDTLFIRLHIGKKYGPIKINQGNVPDELIDNSVRSQLVRREPVSAKRINSILEAVLKSCEDNGYPFARVRIDSIAEDKSGFQASLCLEKGKLIMLDSIVIHGDEAIAPVFLYNYLKARPGNFYCEKDIANISVKLRELPFVKETRAGSVLFTDKYTRLDLYIERKKSSQFDGVIGLLPDDAGSGKPKLTGEAHLKLQNSFKRGETLAFDWRQLPPRSQELNILIRYPFLFNTPVGADGQLNLYRRDTLFVDVIKQLGIFVSFQGSDFLKVFYKNKQSDLQYTYGLDELTTLPSYADITINDYGTQLHLERLDYRLNPRSGFQVDVTGTVGSRNIRRNPSINPVVYDSLTLKSTQFAGDLTAKLFIPLFNRHVLSVNNRTAFIESPNIFDNEMYRIGGLKSLRGFDEESIFATTLSIFNVEYRYITGTNSFLFTFMNGAWYERNGTDGYRKGTPIGFGAGMNVETRLGIFSICYALGKQDGGRFELRSGKVHFGIVNYF